MTDGAWPPRQEMLHGNQPVGRYLEDMPNMFADAFNQAEQMNHELGRAGLISFLRDNYPFIFEMSAYAKKTIADQGYVLIDTNLTGNRSVEIPRVSLATAALFGRPTETDKINRAIVWPITPRSVDYRVKTFSEDVGEAAMHTDSQFIEYPEDKFLLSCVRADDFGKGTSELIDGWALDDIVKKAGSHLHRTLHMDFPFRVPTVFTERMSDNYPEIVWGPILETGRIRFRYDTILSALDLPNIDISKEQHVSLEWFSHIIDNIPRIQHHLLPGEIMIVDNRRMLHARTDFDNRERLLVRVRMNDEE